MRRFIPVLIVAVVLTGCAARGAYHNAVVIEHDTKTIVQAFQQAEMAEFNAGRIGADEHQKLEAGVEKVALAGQTVTVALQAQASQTTILGDVNILVQAVSDLGNNGVLGVKNPQSLAVLNTALNALKALISNLQTEVGAAQTTTGAKP
jgi:hypothetical protein